MAEKEFDRTAALWEILNEKYGIYTMEQLDEALEKLPKLDISIFTKKPKKGKRNGRAH